MHNNLDPHPNAGQSISNRSILPITEEWLAQLAEYGDPATIVENFLYVKERVTAGLQQEQDVKIKQIEEIKQLLSKI